MYADTGILIAEAHGPFGDSYARTRPSDGRILLAPRWRISEPAHARDICKIFTHVDQVYVDSSTEIHQLWNDAAHCPQVSGYDVFMSQALRTNNQGFYTPDLPGQGSGKSDLDLIPGVINPPPDVITLNPAAQALAGFAKVDTRLDHYGFVEFRYHHNLADPILPNPATVDVVVLGLQDRLTGVDLLSIIGPVPLDHDTGWVWTGKNAAELIMSAFGAYKHGLLNQQFDIPLNRPIAIPQPPVQEDGNIEVNVAPFLNILGPRPILRSEVNSIYGAFTWTVERRIRRSFYTWYHLLLHMKVTNRPSYSRQVGSVWVRGIYDRIQFKWILNTRASLRSIFTPAYPAREARPYTVFRTIVRVSNPHILRLKFNITWNGISVNLQPRMGRHSVFDTFLTPAIQERG